jgi:hypothetical protein
MELYLDLLKRSLTNTIFTSEPDIDDDEFRFTMDFASHYINSDAVSMLPLARVDNIRSCIEDILSSGIPGDLIETGVWRGGASIFMRGVLKAHGVTDRLVWVADSFEGLPEPDPEQFPLEAKVQTGPVMQKAYHNFAVGLEEVKRNFAAYGLLDNQVRFLKGWFKDTLPSAPIGPLALMRLDGDFTSRREMGSTRSMIGFRSEDTSLSTITARIHGLIAARQSTNFVLNGELRILW